MRAALRTIIFTYLSVVFSQQIIMAITFKGDDTQSFYLFVLGLSALYFFVRPILKIVSLPSEGLGFSFMTLILTFILIQVFVSFVPLLSLAPTKLSNLIIFGFVLPSKSLTAFWSGVFAAFLIALVYTFLDWLCPKK